MDYQPAILAKDLTKRFGDFTAVDHINFNVQHGEIFGFLGPNGSGKTTTIRMLLGLMKPGEGSVEVLGLKVEKDTSKIRPRVGYMSQRFSLYNDLTVLQNLNFYGQAYGLENSLLQKRIAEALHMAGLERHENTQTRDLSGGWRQRLALGAAILHRPEVLFLDEPTAGVDPLSRRAFWDLLYKLVSTPLQPETNQASLESEMREQRGVTVFITTHYMDEAEHSHRLAFIQHGKIIASGSPIEIKTQKMPGDVLEISPSDAAGAVKVLRSAQNDGKLPLNEIVLYGSLVHVIAPDILRHEQAITVILQNSGIQPGVMTVIEPSLEDVFIACMKS
ncbi:MAG: ABC transporter ATP-binding protein [Anaerolineales bacterium]|nr:ABC transporter ATP-binding protein [Anaerolineales bacterium]